MLNRTVSVDSMLLILSTVNPNTVSKIITQPNTANGVIHITIGVCHYTVQANKVEQFKLIEKAIATEATL